MKAKIKPRGEVDHRVKLQEVVPLNTPFTLFTDPSAGCNFQCKFCPTGDRKLLKEIGRKPDLMSLELFKKIIDDLQEFKTPIKLLRLHKEGEPLLNPNLSKMIRYAKNSEKVIKVDTTTNASLLNSEKIIEIMEAGIDRINISIEGINEDQYLYVSKYKINFKDLVNNIRYLYENKKQCEINVKIPGDWLSEKDKDYFYATFGDISDRIFVENIGRCWPGFDMQEITSSYRSGVYGGELSDIEVCPYIFYSMVINSNGSVSLCCVDWERKLIIGDANFESIKSIWSGRKLNSYQRMHLKRERNKHPICGKCYLASSCSGDDIDEYAEDILKRLNND